MSSNQSELKDYFNYLSETLGIKSLLLESATGEQQIPLLVLVESLNSYSQDEKELLAKMLSALKIPQEQMKVIDMAEETELSAMQSLILCDSPDSFNNHETIRAYSPRILLKQPQLKKLAWEEMQKLLLFFQQQVP